MRDILTERTLDYRGGASPGPVTVRVTRPERSPEGWRAAVELVGTDIDPADADVLLRGVRVVGVDRPRFVERHGDLSCSFCGKAQSEVRSIIGGPSVHICDECVGLCNDLLAVDSDVG